jgi:hypothetical protein
MNVDQTVVMAIMGLFGVGVIGIIQTLKNLLKAEGPAAMVIAVVVSFGATAAILVQTGAFSVLALIVYGLLVFGEASGLYRVFNRT